MCPTATNSRVNPTCANRFTCQDSTKAVVGSRDSRPFNPSTSREVRRLQGVSAEHCRCGTEDFSLVIPKAKEFPSALNSIDCCKNEGRPCRLACQSYLALAVSWPVFSFVRSPTSPALWTQRSTTGEKLCRRLIALLWLMQGQHIFNTPQNLRGTTVSPQHESRKSKARALISWHDTRRTPAAARLPTAVREAR